MHHDLLDRLISCFNSDPLCDVDSTSSAPEGQTTFQALHFSWYNRHSTKGHAAPTDVQPLLLTRLGRSRTNYGQFIPYVSKDITDYAAVYQAVKNILHDVFDWLQEKVHTIFLPIEYERLEATVSVLPDYNISAVHPFVGLVLNFNIATCAHRDSKDDRICLVVPVGEFVGSNLCLVEPGLVLPLRHGDFAVFPSCEVTHFNLPYSGRCCSIVLQTDREMSKWTAEDRNGWAANSFFH
ncbi:hypothetical protein C8Q72DRAFT_790818 [Fomitopsis betulina]|nr:hypothetical protein C8Q72DRAFT_790818 [Fomitopsis betulina]